jgi:hypothetical protein
MVVPLPPSALANPAQIGDLRFAVHIQTNVTLWHHLMQGWLEGQYTVEKMVSQPPMTMRDPGCHPELNFGNFNVQAMSAFGGKADIG